MERVAARVREDMWVILAALGGGVSLRVMPRRGLEGALFHGVVTHV